MFSRSTTLSSKLLDKVIKQIITVIITASIVLGPALNTQPVKAEVTDKVRREVEAMLPETENARYDLENLVVFYKGEKKPKLVSIGGDKASTKNIYDVTRSADPEVIAAKNNLKAKLIEFMADPKVKHVQPQYIYESTWTSSGGNATPNDFDETPTYLTGNHWYYEKSNLRKLWFDQGCANSDTPPCGGDDSVTVMIVDTGLAYEDHSSAWGDSFSKNDDLINGLSINLYENAGETPNDQIDNDLNGYIDDYNGLNTANYVRCEVLPNPECDSLAKRAETGHANDVSGHGTFVTGLIGSLVDNNFGSVSPAQNVTILPVKASLSTPNGGGLEHTSSFGSIEIWFAIDYAQDVGVNVINMSLAGATYDQGLADKFQEARDDGIVIVAATGNYSTTDPYYPAAFDSVIAVGAAKPTGARAFYSNYGPHLDVLAYVGNGAGVGDTVYQRSYTCFFVSPNCLSTHAYGSFSNGLGIGTSYASPQVVALAALLFSAKSTITPQGVENYIFNEAQDQGTSGWDNQTGWGVIDFQASYNGVDGNIAPTLDLTEPDGIDDSADNQFTIRWNDSDPDDDADIDFYWDTDAIGFDGTAIPECTNVSEDISLNRCIFDLRGLPDGTYYVYGCITDYVNTDPPCDYGDGAITVVHTPVWETGKVAVKSNITHVEFSETFETAPVVVAEVVSENGGDLVYINLSNITNSGFDIELQENTNSGWDGGHGYEIVSWYAVQNYSDTVKMGTAHVNQLWKTVNFPSAFVGTPKVFAMVQSENGEDIVIADIANLNNAGFDLRLEEPPEHNGIHTFEQVGWIAFEDNPDAQEGTATTDENWSSVVFPTPYAEAPVVVSSINTETGGDSVTVDIRNLNETGFEFRIEEDIKSLDGNHSNETISWAAFPFTAQQSDYGSVLVNQNWTTVNFTQNFLDIPKVFAEITTENGADTIEVDIKNVTRNNFRIRLEEDINAGWNGNHVNESVTWYAVITPGANTQADEASIDHNWTTINFDTPFAGTPKVFADIQTEKGGAAVQIDIRNVGTNSFDIRLEEDPKAGYDGTHLIEKIVWMAFETPDFGDADTVSIDHNWTTVIFDTPFSWVPNMLAEINTENGAQTVQVDIRNVTENSFEVRLEEEPQIYDGNHVNETVSWFAW